MIKKIALCMSGALVAGMVITSCGNGDKAAEGTDSLVAKSTSDSVCAFYGNMAGGYIGSELNTYAQETGGGYDKKEFMRGIAAVVGKDNSDAYAAGVSSGLRILQDMRNMQAMGVQVDTKLVLAEVRKALMADSINIGDVHKAQDGYEALMVKIQEAAQQREELRKAGSEEALANIKAGEAAIAKQKAETPGFKTTPSGLGYVITKAGEGDNATIGSRVIIDYVGSHLDGKVFDQNNDVPMQPGSNLIAGFTEAMLQLNKGAEGTFYIPGALAYGANGAPQAGIGPMEMLVFKITVKEIEPMVEPDQAAPVQPAP